MSRRVERPDHGRPEVGGEVLGVLVPVLQRGQELQGPGEGGPVPVVPGGVRPVHLPDHPAGVGEPKGIIRRAPTVGGDWTTLPSATLGKPPRHAARLAVGAIVLELAEPVGHLEHGLRVGRVLGLQVHLGEGGRQPGTIAGCGAERNCCR